MLFWQPQASTISPLPLHSGFARSGVSGVLVIGVASVLALALGFVAFTAQPLLVAAVVALMLAPALFAFPVANMWLVLGAGLLVTGLLPTWAEGAAARSSWAVSALGFVLLLRALVGRAFDPDSGARTPAFVWLALGWMVYCIANSLIQYTEFYSLASGTKRYFQAWGILFALAWLPFGRLDVSRWLKFMVVVALIQLPWAVYQRWSLVPFREGLKPFYAGMVPADIVAGTFGAPRLGGGANAEMATFLLIVACFLVSRWRAGVLGGVRLLLLLLPCLAPLFLGETKVVVVLLPLLLVVLFRRELLRRPVAALVWMLAGAVLTGASAYSYLTLSDKSFDRQVYEIKLYNFQNVGYGNLYLNRTTALAFWFDRQRIDDPVPTLVGHGLGTAHDETGGAVARRFPGYGIGLTAMSALLWEQGGVGVVLLVAMLGAAWSCAGKLARGSGGAARADAAAIQASLPVLFVYLFYRSTPIDLLTFQIVIAGLLGYLAWLARQTGGTRLSAGR